MGFRLEGIFPAALLPLLLTMVSALVFFCYSMTFLSLAFFPYLHCVHLLVDGQQKL